MIKPALYRVQFYGRQIGAPKKDTNMAAASNWLL